MSPRRLDVTTEGVATACGKSIWAKTENEIKIKMRLHCRVCKECKAVFTEGNPGRLFERAFIDRR